MASHMSTVGLPITDDTSLAHFATQAIQNGSEEHAVLGRYYRWEMGDGVELWVQINSDDEIISVNPHFVGTSQLRVGLTARIRTQMPNDLDGGFYGWLQDQNEQQVPFVFDVPNYLQHNDLQLPAIVPVQLAAFAHQVRAYRNAAEFELAHYQDDIQFPTKSFVPTGLFNPDGTLNANPLPYAFITGVVVATRTFTNPFTALRFLWAQVATVGGRFDMVCDPDICDGVLMRNSVIKGNFWLSGRLLA